MPISINQSKQLQSTKLIIRQKMPKVARMHISLPNFQIHNKHSISAGTQAKTPAKPISQLTTNKHRAHLQCISRISICKCLMETA